LRKKLYTIGYEGGAVSDFIATLREADIKLLVDVRAVALSRKPGFSKTALSERLGEGGIGYLHLKGLGDPKPGRTAAREGRLKDFREIYHKHLIGDVAQADLLKGIEAASRGGACLMCFERDHWHCHRLIVAQAMAHQNHFEIVHLVAHKHAATAPRDSRAEGRALAFAG
jgi:uncharacterized protein (DUF488 family)